MTFIGICCRALWTFKTTCGKEAEEVLHCGGWPQLQFSSWLLWSPWRFYLLLSCSVWIFTSSQWRGLRASSARRVTTTVNVPLPAGSVCNWVIWSQMAVAFVARTASRRRWFVRRMTIVENIWHLARLHVTHAPLRPRTAAELQLQLKCQHSKCRSLRI